MGSGGDIPSGVGVVGRAVMAVRLILPATGSLAMSAAQFLLVFVLLRRLPIAEFGAMSFLLVVHQFLVGCWSALFAAPLLVFLSSPDSSPDFGPEQVDRERLPAALTGMALVAMIAAVAVVMTVALINGFDAGSAFAFAIFSGLMLTRHFVRAWSLATGRRARVIASDYAYAMVVGGLAAACLMVAQVSLRLAACGQAVAALPALVLLVPAPRTWGGLGEAFVQLGHYRRVWQRDARWSLAGVLASELTANVHAYLVAGLFGAAAYAPIAATALFIRPVLVLINPLVDFERMRMAAAMGQGNWPGVRHQHGLLAGTIIGAWAATALAALAIITLGGTGVLHDRVALPTLWLSTGLWFVVALMRGLHAAEGAVLQAAGQFRMLARLAMMTAALSAGAAMLAAFAGGPIWSTAGVALGEGAYVFLLVRQRRRLLDTATGSVTAGFAHAR